MSIVANPRAYKIPDWFLNRQKDHKTGKFSQLTSSALDTSIRDDLERLKKIRNHRCARLQRARQGAAAAAAASALCARRLVLAPFTPLLHCPDEPCRALGGLPSSFVLSPWLLPVAVVTLHLLTCCLLTPPVSFPLFFHATRGLRHYWGFKVRGQHTKTTSRHGKTVGVAKKK